MKGKLKDPFASKDNFASTKRSMNNETIKPKLDLKQGHNYENDENTGKMKSQPLFTSNKTLINGEHLFTYRKTLTKGDIDSAK